MQKLIQDFINNLKWDEAHLRADPREVHKMLQCVKLDKDNFRCTKCRNPVFNPKECQECGYFICTLCWDGLAVGKCGMWNCDADITEAKTVTRQNTLDMINDCEV